MKPIKMRKMQKVQKAGRVIPMDALKATYKMRKFLNAKEPELILFLQTFWNNQQRAITYKELREAIMAGYLSEKLMNEWYQDYARFVIDKVAPLWQEAMKTANESIKETFSRYVFNPMQEEVIKWTNDYSAIFVTNVTRDQIQAIREVVKRASQLHDLNVDELARVIRPMVGLDWRQAQANMNYYEAMINSGVKPKKALEKSIMYSARQNRHRAMRIARTELAFAYNQGSYYGTKQAQEQNLIGRVVKKWCTADAYYSDGSHRTCAICRSLDGKEIEMDEDFYYEKKNRDGSVQLVRINPKLTGETVGRMPPAHPHCMCTVQYVEVEPPLQAVEPVYFTIDT